MSTNKYFAYVSVTNRLFFAFDINASPFLFLNSKLSADKGLTYPEQLGQVW